MSFMKKLTDDQRKFIEKLMREDRLTLNEMLDEIRAEFPADAIPSRSSLGRAKKNFSEHARKMREIQAAAEALVSELGEDKDDKAGAFMVQGITTLINNLVLDRLSGNQDDPDASIELSVKDALALAKASRELTAARGMSLDQRQKIERIAREKMLEEQEKNLDDAVASKGMTEEQAMFWREKVLGVVR
ncbi:phage protein Gp27 family protein [Acinetobacter bereziniae]|jgi:ClpP class serine protease|uniref:phage protein Gp27 family protein n=1 Tax=Acinetobacter bereziniae TaxID=106648 RepID=UPI00066938D5|nr:phage protein Gp27 family protein [Acinetobacter bereziniae]